MTIIGLNNIVQAIHWKIMGSIETPMQCHAYCQCAAVLFCRTFLLYPYRSAIFPNTKTFSRLPIIIYKWINCLITVHMYTSCPCWSTHTGTGSTALWHKFPASCEVVGKCHFQPTNSQWTLSGCLTAVQYSYRPTIPHHMTCKFNPHPYAC